ncbi:MAG: nucleotidyltransferase family protein [Archangium sp.]
MTPLFEVLRRWPEPFTRPVPGGPWVEEAVLHGVAPWVEESLSAGKQVVPERLLAASRSQLSAGNRHRRFTLDVLDALSHQGVTPVLLKGYGLARRLYSSALSRPASDVDVFVMPPQRVAAELALSSLGLAYQPDAGLADAFEDHHHRAFSGARGLVELHHRLASGFGGEGFPDSELDSRCISAELDGRAVRYLAPEDELTYLAVHAATHSFLRLSWLVDLKRFVALVPLDWELLVSRARRIRLVRPLRVALELSQRLLDAPIPPRAQRLLSSFSVRAPLDRVVFSEERVASGDWAREQVPAFLLHVYLTQSPRQMAQHVFAGFKRAIRRARAGD